MHKVLWCIQQGISNGRIYASAASSDKVTDILFIQRAPMFFVERNEIFDFYKAKYRITRLASGAELVNLYLLIDGLGRIFCPYCFFNGFWPEDYGLKHQLFFTVINQLLNFFLDFILGLN